MNTAPLVWALVLTVAIFAIVGFIPFLAAIGDTEKRARKADKKAYYQGLLVGTDKRLSTSKLNAALWTVVLVYFLLALAVKSGFDTSTFSGYVQKTSPLYLVLIGGPFAAAIVSKSIVSSAVDAGMQKESAAKPKLADIFSDDDGNTDLADTQYVIFNLIAAVIVVVEFVRVPTAGPPDIPAFLAILTGSSAAAYVTNKGVSAAGSTPFSNTPEIDQIVPPTAHVGEAIKILGSNMIPQGSSTPPIILIGGIQAGIKGVPAAGEIDCVVPSGLNSGDCNVIVRTSAGTEVSVTDKFSFTP